MIAASKHAAAAGKLHALRGFIGQSQRLALFSGLRAEEGEYFYGLIDELTAIVARTPKTYETESVKDKMAHLHYFTSGCDWYIVERDSEEEQHQAFGAANLGFGAELGYISIVELLANGAELDFHFKPQPLSGLPKATS